MKCRARTVTIAAGLLVALAAFLAVLGDAGARRQALPAAEVHLKHGIALYQRKDYVHAQAELRRALRANPTDWKAPFYVGVIQIDRKRYGLAIPYLERALTLNVQEPKILNALGVAYFKLNRLDMAKGYFWASLDLDPSNHDARGLMETMAKLQRRTERAASGKN